MNHISTVGNRHAFDYVPINSSCRIEQISFFTGDSDCVLGKNKKKLQIPTEQIYLVKKLRTVVKVRLLEFAHPVYKCFVNLEKAYTHVP